MLPTILIFLYGIFVTAVWITTIGRDGMRFKHWFLLLLSGWFVSPFIFIVLTFASLGEWLADNW